MLAVIVDSKWSVAFRQWQNWIHRHITYVIPTCTKQAAGQFSRRSDCRFNFERNRSQFVFIFSTFKWNVFIFYFFKEHRKWRTCRLYDWLWIRFSTIPAKKCPTNLLTTDAVGWMHSTKFLIIIFQNKFSQSNLLYPVSLKGILYVFRRKRT